MSLDARYLRGFSDCSLTNFKSSKKKDNLVLEMKIVSRSSMNI